MISRKLKTIFAISIPFFIAHGLEEYFTGFYNMDNISKFVFRPFETMTIMQATFLLFQIMFWLLLIIYFLLITNEKWRLRLMIIPGLIYILELNHLWEALSLGGYYPGAITSIPLIILGFIFWKEFIRNWQQH